MHSTIGLVFQLEESSYSVVEESGRVRVGVVRKEGAWGYNLTMRVVPVSGPPGNKTSEYNYVNHYNI